MSTWLHKSGTLAYHHPWVVVIFWCVVLAGIGLLAKQFYVAPSDDISIPGTSAQHALDRFSEIFPEAGKATGRVVVQAPAGKTLDDYKSDIITLNTTLAAVEGVSQSITPFDNSAAITSNRTTGYITVQLANEVGSIADTTFTGVQTASESARRSGLTVELGGDIVKKTPGEILGIGELAGVILALGVLIMTLGSLIAAGIPVVTALVAVGVGIGSLFAIGHLVTITSTTPVLAVMLGLAVGIDYSLFIISKYRSLLLEGYNYPEAAAQAIATAGKAVVFAALTVVIALSALTVVNIPFMSTMGLAGAGTVALAALVATTLIPALLRLVGPRIFRGKTRQKITAAIAAKKHKEEHADHHSFWYKWGARLTRHPVVVIVATLCIAGILAYPVRSLQLGLPTDQYAAASSTERKAYDILTQAFGPGFNGPLVVVVENLPAVTDADKQAVREPLMNEYTQQVQAAQAAATAQYQQALAAASTPQEITQIQAQMAAAQETGQQQQTEALAKIEAAVAQYAKYHQASLVAANIAKLDNVHAAQAVLASSDGTSAVIQVTANSAPSSTETANLITYLRDGNHQIELTSSRAVSFGITGSAALQLDINQKLAQALPQYLLVVVGLSLVILLVAFRSILIPIKATLGFLVSVGIMFGATVATAQWGWFGISDAPGPIVSFVPIIAIGVLFGLAMDYEFFLVSSMHESYLRHGDARRAVVSGFGLGSKVVTAAAVIMIAVFAGFITNSDSTIQTIGFGLAVGVFADAFLVRMTLVPALMMLLGKSAWWMPKWLGKVIPHVSIDEK